MSNRTVRMNVYQVTVTIVHRVRGRRKPEKIVATLRSRNDTFAYAEATRGHKRHFIKAQADIAVMAENVSLADWKAFQASGLTTWVQWEDYMRINHVAPN